MKHRSNSYEVNHIDFYEDLMTNNAGNVQTSQKLSPVFPLLPNCKEKVQFSKKIQFKYHDLNDSE